MFHCSSAEPTESCFGDWPHHPRAAWMDDPDKLMRDEPVPPWTVVILIVGCILACIGFAVIVRAILDSAPEAHSIPHPQQQEKTHVRRNESRIRT